MKTSKNMANPQIAKLLKAVSAAYEVRDEKANKFRIIAYDRAATAIEHLTSEIKDCWDDNKLKAIPGVGASISQYLDELFRTGKVKHFKEIFANLPGAMFELLEIKGIGPKTAFKICRTLKIKSPKNVISKLETAVKQGKLKNIPGFGEDSQKRILKAIKDYQKIGEKKKRMLLPYALTLAQEIIDYLIKGSEVKQAFPLGSLRRKTATVGDIDIAVSSNRPKKVVKYFLGFEKVKRVLESGIRDASVLLISGHQIDLKIQSPESFGALLQHYTGSKHHNIRLRELAKKKGLSLSEYGIRSLKTKKLKKFSQEKDFYQFLGLELIPPELRENSGEIEAAAKKQLPRLVKIEDIKGDFHIHSNFNVESSHDLGEATMDQIVKKCVKMGYQYLGFGEHNPSMSQHSPEQIISILKRKNDFIEQKRSYWNKNFNIKVLNSLEIDIRPNGDLAIPEKGFHYLDFAIVSVHSAFHLSRKKMTQRIIKGLSHPKVKILGHPTGRKISQREGYELDWDKLFSFCKKNGKILEINAYPDRLDLPDLLVKEAVKNGVKLAINTDSHALSQLEFIKYGVYVAQRGWAETENIINALPFKRVSEILGLDYRKFE